MDNPRIFKEYALLLDNYTVTSMSSINAYSLLSDIYFNDTVVTQTFQSINVGSIEITSSLKGL